MPATKESSGDWESIGFLGDSCVLERSFALVLGTAAIGELNQMSNGKASLFIQVTDCLMNK